MFKAEVLSEINKNTVVYDGFHPQPGELGVGIAITSNGIVNEHSEFNWSLCINN